MGQELAENDGDPALDYCRILISRSGPVEVRIPTGIGDNNQTYSGFYNDPDLLRKAAKHYSGTTTAIYTSLNHVAQHHFAGDNPKYIVSNSLDVSDRHNPHRRSVNAGVIDCRKWIPLDFDPIRPQGSASTNDEVTKALLVAQRVKVWLGKTWGWPEPILGQSGNGAHLLYAANFDCSSEESRREIDGAFYRIYRRLQYLVSQEMGVSDVKFDVSCSDAARIWKLYGTLSMKGDPTPARPHREASCRIPGELLEVAREDFVGNAGQKGDEVKWVTTRFSPIAAVTSENRSKEFASLAGDRDLSSLDLPKWFELKGLYKFELKGGDGKHAVYCPWADEHSTKQTPSGTDTIVMDSGTYNPRTGDDRSKPLFHCSHDSCQCGGVDGSPRGLFDLLDLWGTPPSEVCPVEWERNITNPEDVFGSLRAFSEHAVVSHIKPVPKQNLGEEVNDDEPDDEPDGEVGVEPEYGMLSSPELEVVTPPPPPPKGKGPFVSTASYDRIDFALQNLVAIDGSKLIYRIDIDRYYSIAELFVAFPTWGKLWLNGPTKALFKDDPKMAASLKEDRKSIDINNLIFHPGKPPGCSEEEPHIYNRFKGFPQPPKHAKKVAPTRCLEHLKILCNYDMASYEWLLKWLALPLQKPGTKMHTSVIVKGLPGTGKNLIFEAIAKYFYGDEHSTVVGSTQLVSRFNKWASKKIFVIANEVSTSRDNKETMNRLKKLVTDKTMLVEAKGKDEIKERNFMNIIILSNERVPITIEANDRRYFVIDSKIVKPKAYYSELAKAIENGEGWGLREYLLNLDLQGFHFNEDPLYSSAKKIVVDERKKAAEKFLELIFKCRDDKDFEGIEMPGGLLTHNNVLPRDSLWEATKVWAKKGAFYTKGLDKTKFYAIADEMLGDYKRINYTQNGKRKKLPVYIIDDVDRSHEEAYKLASQFEIDVLSVKHEKDSPSIANPKVVDIDSFKKLKDD